MLVLAACCLSVLSCKQYDYVSPLPGTLEIRLASANSRANDLLQFRPGNTYQLTLFNLEARQSGDIRLPIYSDLTAIRRNYNGDLFNCLDVGARDSTIILGRAYSPPLQYQYLRMTIKVSPFVFRFNGYQFESIPVEIPLSGDAIIDLRSDALRIEEGRRTIVTVTMDLDSCLERRTESFLYHSRYYISSVQTF